MTTKQAIPRPIENLAGVQPLTEGTGLTTEHYLAAQNIRFVDGKPEKMAGNEQIDFDSGNAISGVCRSVFSTVLNGETYTLAGTHTRLYTVLGTSLTNITPLKTSSTAAANSLATLYGTLANNPITTANASKVLTIADTSAGRLRAGDTITFAGAATVNGVPDTDINAAQVVRSVASDGLSYTIIVSTAASSSGAGGGASVVRKTGLVELTKAAHGLTDGERVKIAGAATFNGIVDTTINMEFILRKTGSGTFDVMTTSTATASASAAGGAATVYYPQIDSGVQNETAGQGYGMGKYGVGLYGTSLLSSSAITLVRTWFHVAERFANVLMTTPGNQTGLYEWAGSTVTAPVLVSGAPTAINYAFVSNNQVVTLGASGVENRVQTSDTGDRTQWVGSSSNQVFQDDIEGVGRLLSHIHVNGVNLIFSKKKALTMRYVGGIAVWEIKEKDPNAGIIGPMARCTVGGIGFWMSENNFHMWRGGNVEIVPSNSQKQTTLFKYIFKNINRAQLSKTFMWFNESANEIWTHYCSGSSNEPDRIAIMNLHDFSWVPCDMDRTAAEYPNASLQYPRLVDSSSIMYSHEKGVNDNGEGMVWSLLTNDKIADKNNAGIVSFIPDFSMTGNVNVNILGRRWPQAAASTINKDMTVTATTERIASQGSARLWRYEFSGSDLDQEWGMGQCFEELQEGARN